MMPRSVIACCSVYGLSMFVACSSSSSSHADASINDIDGAARFTPFDLAAADLAKPADMAVADLAVKPDMAMAMAIDAAVPVDLSSPCTPVAGAKRVFVTSTGYSGNLMAAGGGTSGLDGGDRLCGLAAAAAGLGGTFRAWLSTSTTDAIDRISDVGPWFLVDRCTKIFDNKASIVVGGPRVGIDRSEFGALVVRNAWTGTKSTGRKDFFVCKDWTNDQPIAGYEGTVGLPGQTGAFWTESSSNPCRISNSLYCFEQ